MIASLLPRKHLAGSSVVAVILLSGMVSAPGCSDDAKGNPPGLVDTDTGQKLILVTDLEGVPADAASKATITLTGGQKFPVTVTSSLGVLTAANGDFGPSLRLTANGAFTLRSACNGAIDPKCGGESRIQAIDGAGNRGEIKIRLTVKENCTNGGDDDGDKLVDCADLDSCPAATACGPNGMSCGDKALCDACIPAEGKKSEAVEASCGDAADNDCDGKVDCADTDCVDKTCSFASGGLGKCTAGVCACAATIEICGNKLDDDCDGKADCEDTDCQPGGAQQNQPCSPTGLTCATTLNAANDRCTLCPGGAVTESACGDAKDNDCDGKLDCEDEDCSKLSCGDGVGQLCNEKKCVDTKTAFTLTVKPARPSLPANGKATNAITVAITNTIKASIANQTVDLTIEGDAQWDDIKATPVLVKQVKTDSAGIATATLVAGSKEGFLKIRGKHAETGNTADASITVPSIASVVLSTIQYPIMGVASSGYQEENKLTYVITGSDGAPYPAGLDVVFEHEPRGRSTLAPDGKLQDPKDCSGPCKVILPGVSKDGGKAEVTLTSGTVADLVTVSLRARAAEKDVEFTPPQSIAVVGARANWFNMAVSCSPGNVPALVDTKCTESLIDEKITCTVVLADRFKNALGLAKVANFYSEAGVVGPPPTTPPYDPTKKPSEQTNLGRAAEVVSTLGALPRDVTPNPGEYSRELEVVPCGKLVHNPRDGVVSIIAAVVGEEGFVDENGNGEYDAGEPFVDLGEPFVDANDDGIHQDDEYFVDVNQSQSWTGPNGVWDANTTIWTETRVTFSGAAERRTEVIDGKTREIFSRIFSGADDKGQLFAIPFPGDPTPTPPNPSFTLIDQTLITLPVYWTDQNFNPLAGAPSTVYTGPKVQGEGVTATEKTAPLAIGRTEGHYLKQEFCRPDFSKCDAKCTNDSIGNRCLVRTAVGQFTHFSAGEIALSAKASTEPKPWEAAVTAKVIGKKPGSEVAKLLDLEISGVSVPKAKTPLARAQGTPQRVDRRARARTTARGRFHFGGGGSTGASVVTPAPAKSKSGYVLTTQPVPSLTLTSTRLPVREKA